MQTASSSIKSRRRTRAPRRFFEDFQMSPPVQSTKSQEEDPDASCVQEDDEEEDDDDDENDDDDDQDEIDRKYYLRTNRAQPLRLIYELQRQPRRRPQTLFEHLPRSPVRRKMNRRRSSYQARPYQSRQRKTNSQGASSSGSTSSSEDDEAKFKRRKDRSMIKARTRCLPMNLTQVDLASHGFSKERKKIGASLADVDPMHIDKTVMFSSIGGHQKHIRALKEMVVFPLLYQEFFEKFNISPSRGCLFYGPPGTGKTLMARALANECSTGDHKVAFFMRKGADCLSKWVGESERQLRLLFDQAYQMRPSIIFFDEIDGLAPVRSSRQDQIHSSIVSTLLALMDGLDTRGQVIVIGATNRIDSIDAALRRPGRFDQEFHFPLPDQKARRSIFEIHTKKWNPPLSSQLLDQLAEKSVGYCGADIKASCTGAAIVALRREFPQIYSHNDKLKIDVERVAITQLDFIKSMKMIVPTAQRSTPNPSHPLTPQIRPLLLPQLVNVVKKLVAIYPPAYKKSKLLAQPTVDNDLNQGHEDSDSDIELGNTLPVHPLRSNGLHNSTSASLQTSLVSFRELSIHRPRLLLYGAPGSGHIDHLAPALLHDMEGVTTHLIDIPSTHGLQSYSPEEACSKVFREALRTSPSIIYLPNATLWWGTASETLRFTFQSLLSNLPASKPVILIATVNQTYEQLSEDFSTLFDPCHELFGTRVTTQEERMMYFAPLFLQYATVPPSVRKAPEQLEELEVAPPSSPPELTEEELKRVEESEKSTMRSLRLFLRDVLARLAQDRRFKAFLKPVDPEEVVDYAEVISNPMDLSTMVSKIDRHQYSNVKSFLNDIDLICSNALEYNPDRSAEDKAIRHRACLLKDMSQAIIEDDLDPSFEKLCNDVIEARNRRHADSAKFAPKFSKVLPKNVLATSHIPEISGPSTRSRTHEVKRESTRCEKRVVVRRRGKKKSRWSRGEVQRKRKKIQVIDDDEDDEPSHDHGRNTDEEESQDDDEKTEESNECVFDQSQPTSNQDQEKMDNCEVTMEVEQNNWLKCNGDLEDKAIDEEVDDVIPDHPTSSVQSYCDETIESNEQPPLVVDHAKLKELLANTAMVTSTCNIDDLEKLHSLLTRCIYCHRRNYDKTKLIQELEKTVTDFMKNHNP